MVTGSASSVACVINPLLTLPARLLLLLLLLLLSLCVFMSGGISTIVWSSSLSPVFLPSYPTPDLALLAKLILAEPISPNVWESVRVYVENLMNDIACRVCIYIYTYCWQGYKYSTVYVYRYIVYRVYNMMRFSRLDSYSGWHHVQTIATSVYKQAGSS